MPSYWSLLVWRRLRVKTTHERSVSNSFPRMFFSPSNMGVLGVGGEGVNASMDRYHAGGVRAHTPARIEILPDPDFFSPSASQDLPRPRRSNAIPWLSHSSSLLTGVVLFWRFLVDFPLGSLLMKDTSRVQRIHQPQSSIVAISSHTIFLYHYEG